MALTRHDIENRVCEMIREMQRAGLKAAAFHYEITHEDWCPMLKSRHNDCTCSVIIKGLNLNREKMN